MNYIQDMKNKFINIYKKIFPTEVVSLKPSLPRRGNVLLSYTIYPFIVGENSLINSHTNQWECLQMAQTFLDLGYNVDVINWDNSSFVPPKNYDFFIDIHQNMERIAPLLNKDCKKILHITGAHWLFQNHAEYSRLLDLQKRCGVTLTPRRIVSPSYAIDYADYATVLGNQFTINTFNYSKKPLYRIPISSTHMFDFNYKKDFEKSKNNFLWLGGSGLVLKGLDLVLEVFKEIPECHLYICGPIKQEQDFEQLYHKELYNSTNIHPLGWINLGDQKFLDIVNQCIAIVYPSGSEGGGGSVIDCMHAGLIPIVSYESSVDVFPDFGYILDDCLKDSIKNMVKKISTLPSEILREKSLNSWKYVRKHHTKEIFANQYKKFVTEILL